MLQDRILDREEFLRLLQIRGVTLDQRVFKGEISFGLGCPINAHANEYLLVDTIAVMQTSMLSVGVGMKVAATVVRERWETWLELVERAERDPRLGRTILPPAEQLFLVVAIRDDRPPLVAAGLMQEALLKLGGYANIYGVSIQGVLHQLRTNARLFKVDLPKRFTVQRDDPGYAHWREEIEAYQKLATMRFKAKLRAKKAGARAKEIA